MAIRIAGVDVINDDLELVRAKLTDIDETINDTAVDVFIYDTSKDSDGGAWRHRTQHTSWYNEGASSTRGSRKEFPAVAVIVAEDHTITIYDGDDPSLPMWMIFPENAGALGGVTSADRDLTSVAMLNGVLVGGYGNGLSYVNFLSEVLERGFNVSTSNVGVLPFNVSERDQNPAGLGGTLNLEIVNATVNDVAMTVLPDAPVDPATGLPVPTIYVFTDGGVSRIADDGTVSSTASATVPEGGVFGDQVWATFITGGKTYFGSLLVSETLPTGGALNAPYYWRVGKTNTYDLFTDGTGPSIADDAFGLSTGLHHFDYNEADNSASMLAITTSDYATGWMPGDIKLAALADTTAETLSGSDLVTNGGFATDTDWTKGTGWTISGGVATHTGADGALDNSGYLVRIPNNAFVSVTYTISGYTSGSIRAALAGGQAQYLSFQSGNGTYTETILNDQNNLFLRFQTNSFEGSIDNVSVRLADPDRSVNGNGLGVHGSITKEAVATGADLVAYSGFNSSNYLEQPYNSDLDFGAYTGTAGTGDFCVMGWLKTTETNEKSVLHRSLSGQGGGLHVQTRSDGTIRLYLSSDTSFVSVVTSSEAVNTGTWQFFTFYRKDGVVSVSINGGEATSVSFTSDISYTDTVTKVGERNDTSKPWPGSLALLRISATAPTADQIRKIYEDEKVLFQPNAKATLTGSSDAVTALAHDPDTTLLHVGTPGGRSVFQGLRRVEEHTGTNSQSLAAISAVDGLVVEGK